MCDGHLERERVEVVPRHDVVDHAEAMGVERADTESEVNSISFALRTPSSHGWWKNSAPHTPIATVLSMNSASSAATMMSHGQISMSPPEIALPCTAAIVGFGTLRHRSQNPR